MKIIPYEDKYRDDLIFMILQAKDALGRKPSINGDLLDIKSNYLDRALFDFFRKELIPYV